MRFYSGLSIAFALTVASYGSWFVTGNQLLSWCSTDATEPACASYVLGVADSIINQMACIPRGVVGAQLVDITVAWLRAHPQIRHEGAQSMVATAIATAFPCHSSDGDK
jgi:hypothetical protein